MAQNRLLIRCTICQSELVIARVSAGETEWTPARAEAAERWPAWLLEHGDHEGGLHVDLAGENDWCLNLSR